MVFIFFYYMNHLMNHVVKPQFPPTPQSPQVDHSQSGLRPEQLSKSP